MTNLMHQLQAWADEKLYDWDNPTLDEGFKWMQMGSSDIRDFQPFEAFRFVDSWEPFVQCVLDGTIQVWRPVEHYKPKTGKKGLALVNGEIYTGTFVYFPSEDIVGFMKDNTESWLQNVTHWQPLHNSELVARLKGGER